VTRELVVAAVELAVWHGVFAPRGTPPVIVQKLSAALIGALKDPDLVKRFREISTEPMSATRLRRKPRSARSQARSTAGRRSSRRPANTRISHTSQAQRPIGLMLEQRAATLRHYRWHPLARG
jgi:hypothetical protein